MGGRLVRALPVQTLVPCTPMDVQVNGAHAPFPPDNSLPDAFSQAVRINGVEQPNMNGEAEIEAVPSSRLERVDLEPSVHNADDAGSEMEDYEVMDKVPLSTGYVYDSRLLAHYPVIAPDEPEYPHPEQPARIGKIYSALRAAQCLTRMRKLPIRPVEKYEALLVHSEDHWDKVEAIALMDDDAIRSSEEYYERLSLYVHKDTPVVAKLSCGGVIETCLAVARGEVRNAFAIVRPPGHHAEPEEHMGFCFFNNVSIAARVVQEVTPVKKILILDWDVHHGNGTQRAFWTDGSVLYISLHRYEQGSFYPSGPFGSMESCGEGDGLGKSVNIPWPTKGMGDADYLYAFQKIVLPIAYEFAPELVISESPDLQVVAEGLEMLNPLPPEVSAGFDAADGDVLGECRVTPAGFAHMTHMLRSLSNGRLAVALEGGYNLDSISSSALAVTKVLLGEVPPELPPMCASEEATETVWQVAMMQSKYWKSIHPKALEPAETSQAHILSIPELLKLYRADYLFHSHKMYQMPFVDDRLRARFDGQMVCTENVYTGMGTLVVFMHDLCNLRVELDGKTFCNVRQEKSYLEDATDQLVRWIAANDNFSYIDLNLFPRPAPQTKLHYGPQRTSDQDIRDLVLYVWDNYVELSEASNVILVCHGPGCRAAMELLKSRQVKNKVRGIIHIVSNGVPPRVPPDEMRPWYRERSLIIASKTSRIFEVPDKVRSRYGNVQPQDADTSVNLLSQSMDQIKAFVTQRVDGASTNVVPPTSIPLVSVS